jgi:DNA recombination protein RmuC
VAYGWRQEQIAENAERISQLGRDVYDRMRILTEHIGRIGTNLGRAVSSYNDAVGSLERRVLPATRKFKELGAAGGDDIAEIEAIEPSPRRLEGPSADDT